MFKRSQVGVAWVGLDSLPKAPQARPKYKSRATLAMEDEPGMQIAVYPLRPRSAGMVSSQPQSRSMVGAVRFVRRLVTSEPIASEIAAETRPGLGVDSDDAILDAYCAMGTTAYHAVGTCRMGSDQIRLRIYGK